MAMLLGGGLFGNPLSGKNYLPVLTDDACMIAHQCCLDNLIINDNFSEFRNCYHASFTRNTPRNRFLFAECNCLTPTVLHVRYYLMTVLLIGILI